MSARNRCQGPTASAREPSAALRVVVVDLLGPSRDLRVAAPVRGAVRGAVQGEARVAPEIERLHGPPHAPEPDLPVGELDLRSADARRAVAAQGGQRLVHVRVEEPPGPGREVGRLRLYFAPARDGPGCYAQLTAAASSPPTRNSCSQLSLTAATPSYPRNEMATATVQPGRAHLARSGRPCPTRRASTCSRTPRARCSTSARRRSIRKRVASHFAKPAMRGSAADMVAAIDQIDFVATETEAEALLAEQNFIKRHRPRLQHPPARRQVATRTSRSRSTRTSRASTSRARSTARERAYFGPFSNAKRVRETLDLLGKVFQYRTCDGPEPGRASGSPCLDYFIKRCQAPVRRLHLEGGVPPERRHDHRLPVRPLPRRSSATSSARCRTRRRRRSSSRPPSTATG